MGTPFDPENPAHTQGLVIVKLYDEEDRQRSFEGENTKKVLSSLEETFGKGGLRTPKWQEVDQHDNLIGTYTWVLKADLPGIVYVSLANDPYKPHGIPTEDKRAVELGAVHGALHPKYHKYWKPVGYELQHPRKRYASYKEDRKINLNPDDNGGYGTACKPMPIQETGVDLSIPLAAVVGSLATVGVAGITLYMGQAVKGKP